MGTIEQVQGKIRQWREKPRTFVREMFGVEPDFWQGEALDVFPRMDKPQYRRMAMKACKGPGKTALLAWLILNFMTCYGARGSHPKGAATSISADNLKDNLWAEIAKWRGRSEFLMAAFELTRERLFARQFPDTWFFSARAWPKSADQNQQADTLAGLHADYLLFVLDESGGIPDAVMATAEAGLATGKWNKIVQCGNPTHLEGPLYRACKDPRERHMWTVIEITGDPDSPKRSQRISKQWAREQIEKYGRDNPWVLVNVFGEFPPSSINVLLGPEEVEEAMKRHYREDQFKFAQKRIAMDVARYGDDRSVMAPRQGLVAFHMEELRNMNSTALAERLILAKKNWGIEDGHESELEFVDSTGGWGAGVIDRMTDRGYTAIPVNFSGKATDDRYFNKRSEMHFLLAEWVKKGGALPPDQNLKKELTTPTYTFSNGKLRLEEKDQIKERLGFSPDKADALAMTFAIPDQLSKWTESDIPRGEQGKLRHEFNWLKS